ncbi:hypothetical protein Bpfe_007571 [Biomphalaria pfeifferi]|uniref:HAT C-terminal dimerisation domain-containing protein n=1 Tax=Biomphalaria pfeifferi TaxID=112525 RepID=A0AAD8BY66_BIOPF|nr:hypothetical protein Bpfe_007571 [Biomphalaria pfeifferi]
MNYLKCYKLFTKQTSTSTSGPAINYNAYIEELPISADTKSALLLELPVFRRWIDNMKVTSLQDVMMEVITGASEIFPAFSTLAVKLLVAPVGTASVERSFSNLNRILTDKRSRLTPCHQDCLLRISSEGQGFLDDNFWATVYKEWCKQPRRFLD